MPIVSAASVAATRVGDNRHWIVDVVVGAILGTVFAVLAAGVYMLGEREAKGETSAHGDVDVLPTVREDDDGTKRTSLVADRAV